MTTAQKYIIIMLGLAVITTACHRTRVIDIDTEHNAKPSYKENILNANKVIAASEETQIDAYLQRRGLTYTKLGDGVRYQEYLQGKGAKIDYEDNVIVTYHLQLLNGTEIYNGQIDTLTIGRHLPNEGLDHALRQLHRGSKAYVIVPSSMGFGVRGDGDRVPSRAVLLYNLSVE